VIPEGDADADRVAVVVHPRVAVPTSAAVVAPDRLDDPALVAFPRAGIVGLRVSQLVAHRARVADHKDKE
jgi:hypothetical protein